MKASELVEQLSAHLTLNGDKEVVFFHKDSGYHHPIDIVQDVLFFSTEQHKYVLSDLE